MLLFYWQQKRRNRDNTSLEITKIKRNLRKRHHYRKQAPSYGACWQFALSCTKSICILNFFGSFQFF